MPRERRWTSTSAAQTFSRQENKRYTDLAATGFGSVQNAQNAQARDAGATAAIERDKANLASALKQVDLLKAEIAQATAAALRANAQQRQAELNLGYTTITGPDRRRRRQPHAARRPICAGRHAIDVGGAGPGRLCGGELQGDAAHRCARGPGRSTSRSTRSRAKSCTAMSTASAPASGQQFALLPPDNATGNFTKMVQRIPVRIALDPAAKHASNCGRACL